MSDEFRCEITCIMERRNSLTFLNMANSSLPTDRFQPTIYLSK